MSTFAWSRAASGIGMVALVVAGFPAGAHALTGEAPVVDAGPVQESLEGDPVVWSGSFTDADSESWTATVDYGDGTEVVDLDLDDGTFEFDHHFADNGDYTVTVAVTDDAGNTGSDTTVVQVANVDPLIYFPGKTIINEGDFYDRSGWILDGGADTWTGVVDFVDGSPIEHFDIPADGTFSLRHRYLNDGTFHMRIDVTDDDGGVAHSGRTAFVVNLAPVVAPVKWRPMCPQGGTSCVTTGIPSVPVGVPVKVNTAFSDAGILDVHEGELDWGDGTVDPVNVKQGQGSGKAKGTHTFSAPGTYTVNLHVTDDAGDTGTSTTQIRVVGNSNNTRPKGSTPARRTS